MGAMKPDCLSLLDEVPALDTQAGHWLTAAEGCTISLTSRLGSTEQLLLLCAG